MNLSNNPLMRGEGRPLTLFSTGRIYILAFPNGYLQLAFFQGGDGNLLSFKHVGETTVTKVLVKNLGSSVAVFANVIAAGNWIMEFHNARDREIKVDPVRGTGRTTRRAVKALKLALKSPGQAVICKDTKEGGTDTCSHNADMEVAALVSIMLKSLGIPHKHAGRVINVHPIGVAA